MQEAKHLGGETLSSFRARPLGQKMKRMLKMKKYLLFLSLTVAVCLGSVFYGWTNNPVRVFGMGEIGDAFFDILIDERLERCKGTITYSDYEKGKVVFGELDSIKIESPAKISFSGKYTAPDNVTYTFDGTVEDLGEPGDGKDKFSITFSDGYSKSGVVVKGDIRIIL